MRTFSRMTCCISRRWPRFIIGFTAVFVFSLVVFSTSCNATGGRFHGFRREGPFVRGLRSSVWPREWLAQLSLPTSDGDCVIDAPGGQRCARTDAAAPVIIDAKLLGAIARAVAAGSDSDALHAAALVTLAQGDTSGSSLRQSISYLEMTVRLDPSPSGFSDLSAAWLALGDAGVGSRATVRALDAADRALRLDDKYEPALFNRAVSLDALGLDASARLAWDAVARKDPRSRRAKFARRRIEALGKNSAVPRVDANWDSTAADRFAVENPAAAETFAWDVLLRDWGEAELNASSGLASRRLASARVVGRRLAANRGAVGTRNAVNSIERYRRDAHMLRKLARAHAAYGRGHQAADTNAYVAADSAFRAVLDDRPPSVAVQTRARLGHLNSLIYVDPRADALPRTRELAKTVDCHAEPLMGGRAWWNTAVLFLRRDAVESGLAAARAARSCFATMADTEDVAGEMGLEAELAFRSGNMSDGYRGAVQALDMLRGCAASLWRHDILLTLSRALSRDGLTLAAADAEDEAMARSVRGIRRVAVAEVHLARARSAFDAGNDSLGHRELKLAAEMGAAIRTPALVEQLDRDADMAEAAALVRVAPDSAERLLDRVIEYDSTRRRETKLIEARLQRATARLDQGRLTAARADLFAAADAMDSARATVSSGVLAAALTMQLRSAASRLIMIDLRNGHSTEALRMLERTRPRRGREPSGPASRGTFDGTIVDFAFVGDTLLAWVVNAGDTALVRTTVDRAAVGRMAERAKSGVERGLPAVAVDADLDSLYNVFWKPIAAHVRSSAVRLVDDADLSLIPFAALHDKRTGRYLVDLVTVSFAPSLDAARAGIRFEHPSTIVIAVDTSTDAAEALGLPPLPNALVEARGVARIYDRSQLINGAIAKRTSIASALRDAAAFHFAGHTLLDDAQPGRSRLVIGRDGVTADSIAELDLRSLDLAVLSACESLRAPDRDGGFFGLTEAFLAAGAHGVVASGWRVDDREAAPLMLRFHREYRHSGDAAAALRAAQVEAMHRTPGSSLAWAGFRYVAQ